MLKRASLSIAAAALAVVASGLFAQSPSESKAELPDGEGKAVVQRMCVSCHEVSSFTHVKRTYDGWSEVVDNMVSLGAQGSDDDIYMVIDYLYKHFGVPEPGEGKDSAK
jgi:cytochrome c5